MTLGKYKRLRRATVQFIHSVVLNSLRPHGLQHVRLPCPSPTFWSLLKLMSIEAVIPSNHLILCCPLLFLPSIIPSIGVFSNESVTNYTREPCNLESNTQMPLINNKVTWNSLAVQRSGLSAFPLRAQVQSLV